MKRIVVLLVVGVLILSLSACGFGAKEVTLGETVEKGITQVTIANVQVADTNFVIANKEHNDFLTPVEEDDLDLGDNFIKSYDENEGVVVITAVVQNVGKKDLEIDPESFVVNYDDGNRYKSQKCYAKTESGGWTEFSEIKLEKVTSGAVEIRIAVWVPDVIVNDNGSSLTLEFYGYEYTIR